MFDMLKELTGELNRPSYQILDGFWQQSTNFIDSGIDALACGVVLDIFIHNLYHKLTNLTPKTVLCVKQTQSFNLRLSTCRTA